MENFAQGLFHETKVSPSQLHKSRHLDSPLFTRFFPSSTMFSEIRFPVAICCRMVVDGADNEVIELKGYTSWVIGYSVPTLVKGVA